MPAGKPNVTTELADLESFITRKNLPLSLWMQKNSVHTENDVDLLKKQNIWKINDSLIEEMKKIIFQSKKIEEVIVEEIKIEEKKIESIEEETSEISASMDFPIEVEQITTTKKERKK